MVSGGDVTVVIPSLPERSDWLARAVASVEAQSVPPADIVIHVDHNRAGAHVARNAALERVSTEWVAFLDDDDVFHPDHLETLIAGANKSGADLISTYPQPEPVTCLDALTCCYKGVPVCPALWVPWGPEQLDHLDARRGKRCPHCGRARGNYIMVTNLARMDYVEKTGGFPAPGSMGVDFAGCLAEDYLFLLAMLDAGARFYHVPGVRTWTVWVKKP